MLKQQNHQSTNRVRTAHTLRVGFEVSCDSQVGCVAQPGTRSVRYAGYGLLKYRFQTAKVWLLIPNNACVPKGMWHSHARGGVVMQATLAKLD